MKFFLLLTAVMAAAQGSSSLSPEKERSCSSLHDNRSLLSNLLQVAGYSDTCVVSALEFCSLPEVENYLVSLMEEARGMVQQVSQEINKWSSRPRHCKDLLDSGDSESGLRQVYPYPGRPHHRVTVYCDQSVDGGGWTVFQRRSNDSVRQDFYRTWIEYQFGFGDLEGEFWLGLNLLHDLTSTTLQQLRIDLDDYDGDHRWAKYKLFHVGTPETNYRLRIGRFSGDAGDAMTHLNGVAFSTHDADHDTWGQNCAEKFRGAWWYTDCHSSNLNGYQHEGNHTSYADGINWHPWRGHHYSLRGTTMKIRPAF